MEYQTIVDTKEIYRLCLEYELHLLHGKMLESIYEQRSGDIQCQAILFREDGIVVLIPGDRNGEKTWEGMLYLKKSYRGSGVAEELIIRAMKLVGNRKTFWHPWDIASSKFFGKLLDKDILTETNFDPKAKGIMKMARNILNKY